MANPVELKIDENVVHALLETKINEALQTAIIDKEQMMVKMIRDILTANVDSEGHFTTSSYNKRNYLDFMAQETIRAAVEKAMKAVFEKKQKELEVLVEKQIMSGKSRIAKAMVEGLKDSLNTSWRSHVTVTLEEPK